jgi:DNA-binding response OmpR family regulator
LAEAPPRRKRILVAEDDAAIATILKKVLSKDYDVTLVNDGQSAVAAAAAQPAPDLLLLDVMMPGLDGISVATQVRALPGLKSAPIIFLTAKGAPGDVIRGIQHGARHYITKPFKIDDLLAKVKKALGGK